MKITVIRHSIRNRGGDRLVLDYCNYLLDQGHTITYWTNEIQTEFIVDSRIKIKKIPLPGIIGTMVFTLFAKIPSDIVLVDLVLMAVLAWGKNRRKVVYLCQDDDRTYYQSILPKKLTDQCYKLAFNKFKINVIFVSEYLSTRFAQYKSKKEAVVPNGIDLNEFYREKKSPYQHRKKNMTTIMVYARSDYRKGFDTAVKALKELSRLRKTRDWNVWTIGEHSSSLEIEDIPIEQFGFLNNTDLRNLLSAADIYLSTSRHEGFGLMQLEAIACGCVMVTTNAVSFVEHEKNGLISNVDDWESLAKNLNRVMDNIELKTSLQSSGYNLAANFNIENSCRNFEKALLNFSK